MANETDEDTKLDFIKINVSQYTSLKISNCFTVTIVLPLNYINYTHVINNKFSQINTQKVLNTTLLKLIATNFCHTKIKTC